MNEEPAHYTTSGLSAAAGVSCSTLAKHIGCDPGELSKARRVISSRVIHWEPSRGRNYIELCHQDPRRKANSQQWAKERDARAEKVRHRDSAS